MTGVSGCAVANVAIIRYGQNGPDRLLPSVPKALKDTNNKAAVYKVAGLMGLGG